MNPSARTHAPTTLCLFLATLALLAPPGGSAALARVQLADQGRATAVIVHQGHRDQAIGSRRDQAEDPQGKGEGVGPE